MNTYFCKIKETRFVLNYKCIKNTRLLFTTLLLLFTVVATAQQFNVNGIYYSISNETNKTVGVAENNNYSGDIVIPSTVDYNGTTYSITSINRDAFYNCAGLKSIYCMKEVPASIRSNNFSDEQYETITLYVPTGSLEKYKTADIWKNFKNFVEFDATNIDDIVEGELNGGENVYYDLNGREVENPTHGIYIHNGNKVLVR